MKRFLATTTLTVVLAAAGPAFAWPDDPPPPAASSHSTAHSKAVATSRSSSASQASQRVDVGSGAGAGAASVTEQNSPTLAPAPFSASGANQFSCPVVGMGVGGAGAASGGLLSYGTTSEDCTAMTLAYFAGQSLNAAQVALLSGHFPEFKKAWEAGHPAQPQQVGYAAPATPSAASLGSGTSIDTCAARPGWTAAEARANAIKHGDHCP